MVAKNDPWSRLDVDDDLSSITTGYITPFTDYLEGVSTVPAANPAEIVAWLLDCSYHDQTEAWQHPLDFEKSRKGNCCAHSLWAWKKLHDLGYQTEFTIGRVVPEISMESDLHAWVMFERDNKTFFLDPVVKNRKNIVTRIEEGIKNYYPNLGVRTDGLVVTYGGKYYNDLEQLNKQFKRFWNSRKKQNKTLDPTAGLRPSVEQR